MSNYTGLSPEDIDDLIEDWMVCRFSCLLGDFLGLTDVEFERWKLHTQTPRLQADSKGSK